MKRRMKILMGLMLLVLCAVTLGTSQRRRGMPLTPPINTAPVQDTLPETSAPIQTAPIEPSVLPHSPELTEPSTPVESIEPSDPPEPTGPSIPPEVTKPITPTEPTEIPAVTEPSRPADEPLLGWQSVNGDTYYYDPQRNGAMAVGEVQIDGVSHFFTSQGKHIMLVNRWHPVPDGYEPKLVSFRGYRVDQSCAKALRQMLNACTAAGHPYYLNAAYRSIETQQNIWNRRYQGYIDSGYSADEAYNLVRKSVAVPGTSEHHLGLALDIDGTWGTLNWLSEHCWEYGFILRYPDGKSDLTGIMYEPWHFRYVGRELAMELYELDMCLEEYMAMLTQTNQA